jgi:hypothetical protein
MQRPSYRRACQACVKAKRKCDLQSPRCSRCTSRDIQCAYRGHGTDIFTTPQMPSSLIIHPQTHQTLPSTDSADSRTAIPFLEHLDTISFRRPSAFTARQFTEIDDFQTFLQTLPLGSPLAADTNSVVVMRSRDTINHLIHTIKSYPAQFLQQFRTPFIHPRCYQDFLPRPIEDAFLLCSAYSTRTPANTDPVFRIFEHRVKDLIQTYQPSVTFSESLAYVQSLILIQIIQLFDGDIRLRATAEEHETTLIYWTAVLQGQIDDQMLVSSIPPNEAWYISESARRTIIMSVMLRAIYDMVKTGFSEIPGTMEHLSFTLESALWDNNSTIEQRLNDGLQTRDLISYSELANSRTSEVVRSLPFEQLLLAACEGIRR